MISFEKHGGMTPWQGQIKSDRNGTGSHHCFLQFYHGKSKEILYKHDIEKKRTEEGRVT